MTLIKIGLYSGRPNPEIELTEEMASQLAERVKSTIGKEKLPSPAPPKLGEFFGFLIITPPEKAKKLGIPQYASVNRKIFAEQVDKKEECWYDVGGIEDYLIELSYEKGFGEDLKQFNIKKTK
jgi:hypothetical protein